MLLCVFHPFRLLGYSGGLPTNCIDPTVCTCTSQYVVGKRTHIPFLVCTWVLSGNPKHSQTSQWKFKRFPWSLPPQYIPVGPPRICVISIYFLKDLSPWPLDSKCVGYVFAQKSWRLVYIKEKWREQVITPLHFCTSMSRPLISRTRHHQTNTLATEGF